MATLLGYYMSKEKETKYFSSDCENICMFRTVPLISVNLYSTLQIKTSGIRQKNGRSLTTFQRSGSLSDIERNRTEKNYIFLVLEYLKVKHRKL